MKRSVVLFVLLTVGMSNALGVIWTETFENGVGRFDQTTGSGSDYITWNETEECLYGIFYRSSVRDYRYASLDHVYNAQDSTLGFSAVVTPLSSNGDSGIHGVARIGFLDSSSWNGIWVEFNKSPNKGREIFVAGTGFSSDEIDVLYFNWATTYYIDALVDASTDIFTVDVYEGIDASGNYIGSISHPFPQPIYVDALGFANASRGGVSDRYLDMNFHETSLTIIPEPTTLSLLALGAIALLRKRRA